MALHVDISGTGPDLVLLHGWGANTAVWNELATQLAPYFRVHRVVLPGHGASASCFPYSLDAISSTLAVELPPRVTVCGWSLGGQMALDWAQREPRQVERLVLIATTPRFAKGAQWKHGIESELIDDFAGHLAQDPGAALRRFFAVQTRGDSAARTVLRRLRHSMPAHDAAGVETLAAELGVLKQTDLRDRLQRVTQPTLILHGERDPLVPLAASAYLQRALPHATLEVCAGAAHAPFLSQPQRIARRIAEFCDGH